MSFNEQSGLPNYYSSFGAPLYAQQFGVGETKPVVDATEQYRENAYANAEQAVQSGESTNNVDRALDETRARRELESAAFNVKASDETDRFAPQTGNGQLSTTTVSGGRAETKKPTTGAAWGMLVVGILSLGLMLLLTWLSVRAIMQYYYHTASTPKDKAKATRVAEKWNATTSNSGLFWLTSIMSILGITILTVIPIVGWIVAIVLAIVAVTQNDKVLKDGEKSTARNVTNWGTFIAVALGAVSTLFLVGFGIAAVVDSYSKTSKTSNSVQK